MNIYFRELKAYRKSAIIWTIALVAISAMYLSMFPSFTHDVTATKDALQNVPAAVREALSLSLDTFFTIYGFFAYILTFITLAGAVQAMNLGTGVISKEESGKTSDFLLSKPVTRSKVISSKLALAASVLLFTNIVYIACAMLLISHFVTTSLDYYLLLLLAGTLVIIQAFFLAIGALLGTVRKKVKSVIAVTLPTVFGFFIISTLGALLGNTTVRYITPFKFVDTQYVITHRAYELKFIVLDVVYIFLAVAITYWVYQRKDVRGA